MTRALNVLTRTPVYWPWVYILVAIATFLASFRIADQNARAARWIAASGLVYIAPLPLIAPSTEFRYSLWLISATLVATALLVTARARVAIATRSAGSARLESKKRDI